MWCQYISETRSRKISKLGTKWEAKCGANVEAKLEVKYNLKKKQN